MIEVVDLPARLRHHEPQIRNNAVFEAADEIERLRRELSELSAAAADAAVRAGVGLHPRIAEMRQFIQQVAAAPDAMVCRLTRDAAKQALEGDQ